MDITATKPVSSVAASPPSTGRPQVSKAASAAAVVSETPAPPPPPEKVQVAQAQDLQATHHAVAEAMREYLTSISRDLQFTVDTESGTAVITVTDASGNVVRKIPGEEALQRMRRANAQSGTLIDSLA
jgi:flagellar protein FlaG